MKSEVPSVPTTDPAKPRELVKTSKPAERTAGVRQIPEAPKPASPEQAKPVDQKPTE